MCDPTSLAITAATSLARAKFQNDAAQEIIDAKNAARDQFHQRIDEQRKKAGIQFEDSVRKSGKTESDEQIEKAIATRAALNEPTFETRTLLPGQGDASQAVKTSITNAQNIGSANIADEGERAAILAAFGDADLRRNIGLLQNANRISTAGNFAQGAIPILQADIEAAERAGDSSLGTADFIGGIGTLAAGAASGLSAGGFTIPGTGTDHGTFVDVKGVTHPIPGTKPTRINLFPSQGFFG